MTAKLADNSPPLPDLFLSDDAVNGRTFAVDVIFEMLDHENPIEIVMRCSELLTEYMVEVPAQCSRSMLAGFLLEIIGLIPRPPAKDERPPRD